jgi:hypothetical protein
MASKNRSHRANHYGTLVERQAAERYRLELERCSWHDALRPDRDPVEIKAAMRTHSDGQPGNFKIYEDYHDQLRDASGWYVFAPYRVRGRGVEVLAWEMRHSSRIPSPSWHGGGAHRDSRQAKIGIGEIFG